MREKGDTGIFLIKICRKLSLVRIGAMYSICQRFALLIALLTGVAFWSGISPHALGQTSTPQTQAQTQAPVPEAKPMMRPTEGDPGGSRTGVMEDAATASGTMTPEMRDSIAKNGGSGFSFLAEAVGQNRIAINMVWIILCGVLVMLMQAGFALVETGFTRAKNASHTFLMNFTVYFLGMLGFWAVGFGLMMGNAGSIFNLGGTAPLATGSAVSIPGLGTIFGTNGFFLSGQNYDVSIYALFLFQMVFMDAAATIPTGAMAERWKFTSFIVFCFFMSMFLYPIFGHWAWGGGWLSQLGNTLNLGCGYVDFAGSGVVHAIGGFCGLAGASALGPRIGKFNRDGQATPIPGHDVPMALLGVLILGFGWFAFNAGSSLGASGAGNLRIGVIATNTMLASAGGATMAMILMYHTTRKPDPTMIANGFLGGLVSITASCAFVSAPFAVLIGAVGGAIVCWGVQFVDRLFVDDPVGAVSVHGFCGLWGLISVGLFADGIYGAGWNGTMAAGQAVPLKGLLMGGGFSQLAAQLIGCATVVLWSFGLSLLFFKTLDRIMGIRSRPEDEINGLDIPETGILAYPTYPTEVEMEMANRP
jgi:Amt family ammonium transporter